MPIIVRAYGPGVRDSPRCTPGLEAPGQREAPLQVGQQLHSRGAWAQTSFSLQAKRTVSSYYVPAAWTMYSWIAARYGCFRSRQSRFQTDNGEFVGIFQVKSSPSLPRVHALSSVLSQARAIECQLRILEVGGLASGNAPGEHGEPRALLLAGFSTARRTRYTGSCPCTAALRQRMR